MPTEPDHPSPFPPLMAELARMRNSNLTAAMSDVDGIIDLLVKTRADVAQEIDAHRIGMAMTTLQNPVKARFEAINQDLKEVTKAQKSFGKALDKALPNRELPMVNTALTEQTALVNRAIAMHMLREGQFTVASSFIREATDFPPYDQMAPKKDRDGDDAMETGEILHNLSDFDSDHLQASFAQMYTILAQLKQRNLVPAIEWAAVNSAKLESKGSNLEFELSRLQYVWLFKGPQVNGLPDDENNGPLGALRYARQNFVPFSARYLREIQQLCCALIFASNMDASPYNRIFQIDTAFEDVSMSFTREFCSLLGLAAESPLYVAVTAGALALPRLIKYTTYSIEKKTAWTTSIELGFETPLPESMIYHPIFVCPVSKEQTTDKNPSMILPCGHVICKESLQNIQKNKKFKCPYCPMEGSINEPYRITF